MSPAWNTPVLPAAAAALALALAACAGGARLPPPPPQTFSAAEIQKGAELAKLADCQGCHTADGGQAFAGGRPLNSPFGTIYTRNITPDPRTGLGRYSREAFIRALRRGVRFDGAELYPAMPYDHFAYADDEDLGALYAYLMTRRPKDQPPTPNKLIPPANIRGAVAIWKALFFHPGRFQPTPGRSVAFNRGAYLVQSLGHCGACHTPHNFLDAEETSKPLQGGVQEGWYAPPLNALSPASVPWTPEHVYSFLRTGFDRDHSAAAGPMGSVVRELARAPEADVRALSVYLATLMQPSPAAKGAARPADHVAQAAAAQPAGARLYAGACAACHDAGAAMMREGRPPLQFATPPQEDRPTDVVQVILHGLQPATGPRGPYMPAFAGTLSDAQVADVAAYVRARYSDRPPWKDLASAVAKARRQGGEG